MRPTWGQLRQFCVAQQYHERIGDHDRYFKVIDGRYSAGTMISHGAESETIPTQLWGKMWRHQLHLISEAEFWRGLDGSAVNYDFPPAPQAQQPLPDFLQRHLRDVLHWSGERIVATTRDEPQNLLNAYYARELQDPST